MSAVISADGLYRYELVRELSPNAGMTVGWVLHNPSTADAEKDDPTSRRGIGFSTAWGARRMIFVNPWAYRCTNPDDLWKVRDPIGPDNDKHILRVAEECKATGGFMVAGWGAVKNPTARSRLKTVEAMIRATGCSLRALGITKERDPRHPLYLRSSCLPMEWPNSWNNT